MAKATFKMPEEFLLKISRLQDKTDQIVTVVLQSGAEVVEKAVKDKLEQSIGKDTKQKSKSTGQLLSALGYTKVRQDKDGNYDIKIGFAENRKDGKRNGMIAAILEYGKSDQQPRPFLKPAKSASKKSAQDAMIKKLEEEISKL